MSDPRSNQHDTSYMDEFVGSVRKMIKELEEFNPKPDTPWGNLLKRLKRELAAYELDKPSNQLWPEGTHDDR